MKKLLIHSNNTSFNNTELFPLAEQFVFDVDFDKDVDFYINENLTDGGLKLKLEKCDIVFIKVSLSKNYLEYLGLRLAYHIRLTKSLGAKAYMPIVLIAEESFQYLGLTHPEPSILFTKGIYLIKELLDDYQKALKWFADGRIKPLDDFSLFVNSIFVNPPANYQSHHSIANEWALVRYFSMLESDDSNILYVSLQNKIYDLDYLKTLHFKHIEAKANRQKFNSKKHTINAILKGIEGKKIGIIDDEINKGWLEFYGYILNKSKATAMPFNNFQKDETKVELIKKIEQWLLEIFKLVDPIDIFIIDLRLHDDDFSEQDFQNLSGIQIIKFLKKYNPGIQVVVSTASNKVWNYQKCLDLGVKYFSVKESPETYNTRSETIASFSHFSNQLSNAVKDVFLAEIFRKIEDLKKNNIFSKITLEKDKKSANLIIEKNGLLDQIFNLLRLDNSDEAIIHQCLLIAFQILENYCEIGMVGNFGSDNSSGNRLSSGSIWAKDESGPKHIFINQPNQKISTWFELVNGRFPFQKEDSNETPVSFNVFESMRLISSYKSGLDISSLVKMITILYFRDNIPKNDVNQIMALRYYRSNVAAHLTGKVKTNYRINANDISFFIDVFTRLFK
jgi:CheY-like chemotaxis protein